MVLAHFWVAVTGEKPDFREEPFGDGDRQVWLKAMCRKPGIRGTWIKDWGGDIVLAAKVADKIVLQLR